MPECQPILAPEPFGIRRQIRRELCVARLRGRHVLDDEFHLLAQAAANDDVVAIKPQRPALAIEHLVANVVIDEAAQLLRARRALPGAGEAVGQVLDPRRGNDDPRRLLRFLLADQIEETEQRCPEDEEVQQRLLQQTHHGVCQPTCLARRTNRAISCSGP